MRSLLGPLQLAGVTFFAVCGGPYGLEPAVKAAGPGPALLGILLLPWLWGLPQALLTAELSIAMPDAGGPVGWIHGAFGRKVAANFFICSMLSSTLDSALYPIMFSDYLVQLYPTQTQNGQGQDSQRSWWLHRCIGLILIIGVTLINHRPVREVGKSMLCLSVLVIIPFAVLITSWLCMGIGSWHFDRLWLMPMEPKWNNCVAVLLWCNSGFDAAGMLASDVREPTNTYMKAMLLVLVATTVVYLLPVLAGVLGPRHFALQEWDDGHWVQLGDGFIGRGGGMAMVAAGAASAAGLFSASLCANARALAASVPLGLAPGWLGWKKAGAPVAAVSFLGVGAAALAGHSFEAVVGLNTTIYALRQALQFAALVRLRLIDPHMPRPFCIPLSPAWLCVMAAPAWSIALAMLVSSDRVSKSAIVLLCVISCALSSWHSPVQDHWKYDFWSAIGSHDERHAVGHMTASQSGNASHGKVGQ